MKIAITRLAEKGLQDKDICEAFGHEAYIVSPLEAILDSAEIERFLSAFHEGDTQVVVDPDTCIDCGICISECPQGAIASADDADEKWVAFNAEKAKEWPVCDK